MASGNFLNEFLLSNYQLLSKLFSLPYLNSTLPYPEPGSVFGESSWVEEDSGSLIGEPSWVGGDSKLETKWRVKVVWKDSSSREKASNELELFPPPLPVPTMLWYFLSHFWLWFPFKAALLFTK
jgi:hypothetical protein